MPQMLPPLRTLNIANLLTLIRIGLIPIFVICFYLPFEWRYTATALLFALAAITDWLDGFIARRLQQSTKLGAFMDPVADKLMVVVALVLLVEAYASPLIAIPACIIVAREVAVSALREWMAEMGSRGVVAVSYIGKVKTTAQMGAIVGLLAFPADVYHGGVMVSLLLLYLAVAFTIWSMILYLKAAWPVLIENETILWVERAPETPVEPGAEATSGSSSAERNDTTSPDHPEGDTPH